MVVSMMLLSSRKYYEYFVVIYSSGTSYIICTVVVPLKTTLPLARIAGSSSSSVLYIIRTF